MHACLIMLFILSCVNGISIYIQFVSFPLLSLLLCKSIRKYSPLRTTADVGTDPMDGSGSALNQSRIESTNTYVYGLQPVSTRVIGDVTIRKFVRISCL